MFDIHKPNYYSRGFRKEFYDFLHIFQNLKNRITITANTTLRLNKNSLKTENRGLIYAQGSIIGIITGNLDGEDDARYDRLNEILSKQDLKLLVKIIYAFYNRKYTS